MTHLFATAPATALRALWLRPEFRALAGALAAALVWRWPSSGLADVLLWGLFAVCLPRAGRLTGFWLRRAPLFAAFAVFAVMALPLASDPSASAWSLLRPARAFAFAFALPALFDRPARLRCALGWSAAIVTAILAADLFRLLWALGPAVIEKGRFLEPYPLNHPNVASLLAALSFWVWAFFAWEERRRPWRAAGCAALAVADLASLAVLASRGPQMAFAVSVLAFPFVLPGRRLKWVVLAGVAGLAALVALNLERINPRLFDKTMSSFSGRDVVWSHTLKLAREKPLTGYGYGKETFQRIYRSTNPPPSPFLYPHPHHLWLKTLFEYGAPGVLLLAGAWAALARTVYRALRSRPPPGRAALLRLCLLLLVCLHVYGLGDFPDGVVEFALVALVPIVLVAAAGREEPTCDWA